MWKQNLMGYARASATVSYAINRSASCVETLHAWKFSLGTDIEHQISAFRKNNFNAIDIKGLYYWFISTDSVQLLLERSWFLLLSILLHTNDQISRWYSYTLKLIWICFALQSWYIYLVSVGVISIFMILNDDILLPINFKFCNRN